MLKTVKELYDLLTPSQRKRLLRLQILVIIMSFAEIAGVISIGPFMAVVGDMSLLEGDGIWGSLYDASGFESHENFLFWMGIFVLAVLFVASLFSIFTMWHLFIYAQQVGAQLSERLFQHYLFQPWLFHSTGSSANLTKQIAQEASRVTDKIIQPLLQMSAKAILSGLMMLAIFIYNPMVALAGAAIFSVAYFLLYRIVRRRLEKNGKTISEMQTKRFKLMGEGFGGIKDILLLGRQNIFSERFSIASRKFARSQGVNQAMSQVPRYAMELVAFGSVMLLVLYLLKAYEGDISEILPVLAVYAFAGFKILPSLQQIYRSFSLIKGNIAAFESIHQDLRESYARSVDIENKKQQLEETSHLHVKENIYIKDVSFFYPDKKEPALNSLNMLIPARKTIGIVGASGSGKSTTIDILLGLITPSSGEILVDDLPLSKGPQSDKRMRAWQNSLGFVPQTIFLSDSSIRENIAFGIPDEKIDQKKLEKAVELSHLEELLRQLPDGLETRVGERGVQLSGGQRQRIGIARALYHEADVLILDEATSALDNISEKLIMDAIHDFAGSKTIIMIAHRLSTVKQCDMIFLMEGGKVVDQGSYEELVAGNNLFKKMAQRA
ncbi:HlyD family secretion protein [Modicisalibacter ilicicola DSM 19980]|uniref:HlyD family secretion protein n=1 Tax=Modicisalibacter ilicicola DSM 19980 TaxID=1121942 RepID=A0A1M5BZL1_9GAMM|nr:ABC transporter ATP-binding protein [Halomonas ilicicola]SHF47974.1 HlyD family secretion protein [Halomonas ilicicola DSM 19980]